MLNFKRTAEYGLIKYRQPSVLEMFMTSSVFTLYYAGITRSKVIDLHFNQTFIIIIDNDY